jgi:hypothetical protein
VVVVLVSPYELLARLIDEIPAPECVVPADFLDDEALPRALAPVEPRAFVVACGQSLWGTLGPLN